MSKAQPASKLWMETEDGYVFGPGVYMLLKAIEKTGTLKAASQELDMSYRYAWGLIKKAEAKLGDSLIKASKGGRLGGGSSSITELGLQFIEDFEHIQDQWKVFLSSTNPVLDGEVVTVNETETGFEYVIHSTKKGVKPTDKVTISLL